VTGSLSTPNTGCSIGDIGSRRMTLHIPVHASELLRGVIGNCPVPFRTIELTLLSLFQRAGGTCDRVRHCQFAAVSRPNRAAFSSQVRHSPL